MLMYLYCPTWYSSPGLDLATSMHAFPIPIANLECYGGRVLGRLRGVRPCLCLKWGGHDAAVRKVCLFWVAGWVPAVPARHEWLDHPPD